MNLPSSLVVTAIITLGIWLAVAFQPQASSQLNLASIAEYQPLMNNDLHADKSKITDPLITVPSSSESQKAPQLSKKTSLPTAVNTQNLAITGITAVLALTKAESLWTQLNNDSRFTTSLTTSTPTMYAYYRDFNADYSEAKVSVGYHSEDITLKTIQPVRLYQGDYQALVKPGLHDQTQLLNAWQKIDYQRTVKAVLEKHTLNEQGQITSSSLLVLYKD